jgi:two-component system sensor histidine kinase KdpD
VTDDNRPDPDALLARFRAEEQRETRARLKIFFGAAPGVGKTFSMLESARRLEAEGVDVVVGCVETHGRAETAALLDGLEVLPRRTLEYRGVQLTELDLEAALRRRPEVILVDELAHTNAPGSRHVKRWQDVMELLDAGIDVHSTLNVQHLESLGDVVQQITGVRVRETIPDVVLERADEIELVDVPPEELLDRLSEGKVYLGDAAGRAAQHFFQRGNLLALRELALRRTAERVDSEMLAYRRQHGIAAPWPAGERLMVCVGASPGSERLIRATRRMAEKLHVPWVAATVDRAGAPPLGDRDRERLEGHLRLVESLGGEVVRLRGVRVADALLTYARAHNVTRLVAGKPTHPRWRDRLRGSLHDDLIRGSGAIEVLVLAPIDGAPAPPAATPAGETNPWAYLWAAAAMAVSTAIGLVAFPYFELADVAMLYLMAIMIASLAGRGPSLFAASLAVAAFDFCFVPPRFTFAVSDASHLLTFGVMFGAGLAIATLTVRLRRQEDDARLRERRTAALLAFTRELASSRDIADIAAATARHVEDVLDVAAAVLVPDDEGGLTAAAGLMPLASQEVTVARWAFEHRQPAGQGTDTLPGAHILAIPLLAGDVPVAVVAVQTRRGTRYLDAEQRHVLEAFVRQTAMAIGRQRLVAEAREAALRARTEELRSSLLSTVSHDLRTPLAVITGAATSLRDDAAQLSPSVRAELLDTLVEEARRLERVLANLLGMTRVETGIQPAREWVPVEELVGAALGRVEDVIGDRAVQIDVPSDLAVSVDPVLFEHVLINLLENAVKHGAPPLEIAARRRGAVVEIDVADRGPGLPPGAEERVFVKVYRASSAPGVGLGLAIVRGVVEAHGGTVTADNGPGGGARFRIALPVPEAPIGAPVEPAAPEARA